VGDLGYSVIEQFASRFPRQYVNAGVAEQNMTGLAAGMALAGRRVFTYSIGNFPTMRCLEQVRNDVCYHGAAVTIVTVGGGFAYGALGVSHHATEDLAIMRSLPRMTVVAPGDPVEAGYATHALAEAGGPAYLRLGKAGEPVVHDGPVAFQIGRALTLREGSDVTLIATGGLLHNAVRVGDTLATRHRVQARVLSMHTIKPIDREAILAAASETGAIVTVEEHSIIGGLGSAVAEVLAEAAVGIPFRAVGIPSAFDTVVGSQEYLRGRHGLTVEGLLSAIEALLAVRARR
jgi:transketolase